MTATARALTAPELALLRSDQQYSKVRALFIPQPTVFQALVNGVPASNESVTQVNFNTVTVGSYSKLVYGMTMYVYSPTDVYLGMVRVRSATSTIITIGRCSDIVWVDHAKLIAVDDFGFWAKLPLLPDDTQVWMDDDVAYASQNVYMQPVPIMGSDMAVSLTSGSIQFDSSNSYTLDGSSITTRAWSVVTSGSTVFTSGSVSPVFSYSSAGLYRENLAITATNGKTTTGHRTLYVYNDTDPEDQLTVTGVSGTVSDGGWEAQIEMWEGADLSQVKDRSKIILLSQDFYGGSAASIGQVAGQEQVLMVGWIDGDSINYDREVSTVKFTVRGAKYWIDKITSPSTMVSIISTADAVEGVDETNSWLFFPNMNIDIILHHFTYWRSTVMEIMDVYPSNNNILMSGTVAGIASIWSQISTPVVNKMLMRMGVDRYGRLFLSKDPQLMTTAERATIPVVQAITGDDLMGMVDIKRVVTTPVAMVSVSAFIGVQIDTIAMSRAPGALVYKRYGENKTYDSCVVTDQDEANVLSGNLLAKLNNEYPDIVLEMAENNRMFDIAPAMYATLSVSGSQNARGISFTDKKMLPKRIDYNPDPEKGYMLTQITFEAETQGVPGVTVVMPPEPIYNFPPQPVIPTIQVPLSPIPDYTVPTYEFPPYIPRIPTIPPISGSGCNGNGPYDAKMNPYAYNNVDASRTLLPFRCEIRPGTATCKTTYELSGMFQKFVSGSFSYTSDDAFYNIYGVNASGSRIATFTHNAVSGSGISGSSTRTGYFSGSVAKDIEYLELGLITVTPFRPTKVRLGNFDTNGASGSTSFSNLVVPGTLTWGYNDAGVWVKLVNSLSDVRQYAGGLSGLWKNMYTNFISCSGSYSGSTALYDYTSQTWRIGWYSKKALYNNTSFQSSGSFPLQVNPSDPYHEALDGGDHPERGWNWKEYQLTYQNYTPIFIGYDRRAISISASGSSAIPIMNYVDKYFPRNQSTPPSKELVVYHYIETGWNYDDQKSIGDPEFYMTITPIPTYQIIVGGLQVSNVDASPVPSPTLTAIDVGAG
jgi:hypothetical protein